MNYFMFVEAKSSRPGDSVFVAVNRVDYTLRSTQIELAVSLHRLGGTIDEIKMTNSIPLALGSNKPEEVLHLEVSSLKVESLHCPAKPTLHSPLPNRFKFIDKEHSLPLGVFDHYTQIYSSLDIQDNCTL
jgi:hypothetical protein